MKMQIIIWWRVVFEFGLKNSLMLIWFDQYADCSCSIIITVMNSLLWRVSSHTVSNAFNSIFVEFHLCLEKWNPDQWHLKVCKKGKLCGKYIRFHMIIYDLVSWHCVSSDLQSRFRSLMIKRSDYWLRLLFL